MRQRSSPQNTSAHAGHAVRLHFVRAHHSLPAHQTRCTTVPACRRSYSTFMNSGYVYVFDLGLGPGVLASTSKKKKMMRAGWHPCKSIPELGSFASCLWFSSGIMTVCIDPSGLGFLQSEYPLRDETMEYAQRRIRRIGRIMNWDCTYGYRRIIRRIALSPVPSRESDIRAACRAMIKAECESMTEIARKGRFDFRTSSRLCRQRHRLRGFRLSPLIGAEEWWGKTFLQEADERLDAYFSGIDDEAKGAERLLMFVVSAATVLALFTSSWGDYESAKRIFLYIALMFLFLLFLISVPRK